MCTGVCAAARWYIQSFGAALTALGSAELLYLQRAECQDDVDAYARAGLAELEAWLHASAVKD